MTQRTINLYDGLETLYYFDTDYYNAGIGEIKDKSGHERHARANGSPTVGVNGPNDFEAAKFSGKGSGDYFSLSDDLKPNDGDSFSVFLIVRRDFSKGNETALSTIKFKDRGFTIKISGNVNVRMHDTGDNKNSSDIPAKDGFKTVGFSTDGQEGYTGFTSLEKRRNLFGDEDEFDAGNQDLNLGLRTVSNDEFSGSIALFGMWSREITHAEMDYLTGLTAPRRAQL